MLVRRDTAVVKASFFDALWNIVAWDDVAARFANAQKIDLHISQSAK